MYDRRHFHVGLCLLCFLSKSDGAPSSRVFSFCNLSTALARRCRRDVCRKGRNSAPLSRAEPAVASQVF